MDQKSVDGHVRGSSAPAMAEAAALPAMNKPPRAATACRTRPNASHFASGNSALTTRAAGLPCPSPSSEIDVVDMADQDRSTSQALAAKKRKRNSTEDKTIMEEDYIHVRAQRGQATNSHSLAERVRREKISLRMKFLQELVPGCSKVTGKAVMLDEIINYVQSLQRQVEFLSMKLAAVNPIRMDSTSTDHDQALLSKDQRFLRSAVGFSPADLLHAKGLPSQQAFGRAMSVRLDSVPNAWEEQLQNVMQMACFGKDFDQQPRTQ